MKSRSSGAPNGQAREDLRRSSPLGGPRCFRQVQEFTEFPWGIAVPEFCLLSSCLCSSNRFSDFVRLDLDNLDLAAARFRGQFDRLTGFLAE